MLVGPRNRLRCLPRDSAQQARICGKIPLKLFKNHWKLIALFNLSLWLTLSLGASHVSLEGSWQMQDSNKQWIPVELPGPWPSKSESVVEFKREFYLPHVDDQADYGLLIGTIGTFAQCSLNGVQLNSEPLLSKLIEPPANYPRLFPIPIDALHFDAQNMIHLIVERSFNGPAGILAAPITIGEIVNLQAQADRRMLPYYTFEIVCLSTVSTAFIFVGLLSFRTRTDRSLIAFLVLSCLIVISLLSENHLLYRLNWKSEWVVRAGWCAYALILPALLYFQIELFQPSSGLLYKLTLGYNTLVALLLLLIPDPSDLAIPFTSACLFTLSLFLKTLWHSLRTRQDASSPFLIGIATFVFASLLAMAEILGCFEFSSIPIPQKSTLFFQLGLISLYACCFYALACRFIKSKEYIQSLIQRSLESQDLERNRIGRDLHDQVGQSLQGILLQAQLAARKQTQLQPAAIMDSLKIAIEEVRRVSADLHPPALHVLPIEKAIECFLQQEQVRLPFAVHTNLTKTVLLSERIESHLYNILREALHNCCKHAQAKNFYLNLENTSETLRFEIKDDGQGTHAPQRPQGIGLQFIRERVLAMNGSIQIDASPGRGFHIKIQIPLAENSNAQQTFQQAKDTDRR